MTNHFFPWLNRSATFPAPCLLDVTLRDGSFAVNFQWSERSILAIVGALALAGMPLIELGYHGGVPELHDAKDAGLTADFPLSLLHDLAVEYPATQLALMVHPDALKRELDFSALREAGLTLVRFVYHQNWSKRLERLLASAQEAGLQTSVNLALSSRYPTHDLLTTCRVLAELRPDMLYLADTCSAFYPDQIASLIRELVSTVPMPIGFHSHDFLSLAFANTLAAAQAGATYVDVSLRGIGRGAGNLRAELWCTASVVQEKIAYNLEALLPALEEIQRYTVAREVQDWMSIVAGSCNLTPPEEQLLRETVHYEARSEALLACRYSMRRSQVPHLTTQSLRNLLQETPEKVAP